MGYLKCSSWKTRQKVPLLSRTLPGYLLQYDNSSQTLILHCQFNHPLRRNLLPFYSGVLYACSIKTENLSGKYYISKYSTLMTSTMHLFVWSKIDFRIDAVCDIKILREVIFFRSWKTQQIWYSMMRPYSNSYQFFKNWPNFTKKKRFFMTKKIK